MVTSNVTVLPYYTIIGPIHFDMYMHSSSVMSESVCFAFIIDSVDLNEVEEHDNVYIDNASPL